MAQHTVTLIPGDGIGLETSAAMQRVVEAAGADIAWEVAEAGAACAEKTGTPLPDETVEAVKRNKVAIKGPCTTPVGTGFRSVNVALRKTLDLYVCLRPVVSLPGAGGRYDDVDLTIVRENSEDLYAGVEFEEESRLRASSSSSALTKARALFAPTRASLSSPSPSRLRRTSCAMRSTTRSSMAVRRLRLLTRPIS